MTTGMLADDEGLLTKQDFADLLQVAVDAASLAADGHWAALSGGSADWCATGKSPSNDGRLEASRPDPPTRTAGNVVSQRRCANHTGICGTGTKDPPLAWQPFAKTNGAPCSAIMRALNDAGWRLGPRQQPQRPGGARPGPDGAGAQRPPARSHPPG